MKNGALKINVYEPVGNDFVKSEKENSIIEEVSPGVFQHDTQDLALRITFLKGNPFFYNSSSAPFKVHSIEDYIVTYKKQDISFGDFVHSDKYPFNKKKRFTKKTFRTWNKEFLKKKKDVTKSNTEIVNVIGDIEYLGFTLLNKVLMYVGFVLFLILLNTNSSLWVGFRKSSFGLSLHSFLNNTYVQAPWVKMVGLIGLYILLILILYSTIHNKILKDYRLSYSYARNSIERSKKKINKEYRKKYRTFRNFYIKQINKKRIYFEGIKMEDVELNKVSLDYFGNVTTKIVSKANRLKKTKLIYISSRIVLTYTAIICGGILVIYMIYSLIINLL